MYNPVEGVDYIFDRYAFLGIAPDAEKQEIEKAISTIRKQNHPDALMARGEEHQKLGKKMTDLADKCSDILLDDTKRKIFDERLDWFKTNKPKCISTDGAVIVDVASLRVDVDSLLQEHVETHDGIQKGMIPDVSNTMLSSLKKNYTASPDDNEARDAYREALLTRFIALEVKEDLAWQQAGIHGRMESNQATHYLVDASYYKDDVSEEIEHTKQNIIPEVVNVHIAGYLGGLPTTKLLASSIEENSDRNLPANAGLNEQAMAAITTKALENFAARTHRINMLAEEKQEILQQILELSPTHELKSPSSDSKETLIFLMLNQDNNQNVAAVVSFNNETREMAMVHNDDYQGASIEKLKNMKLPDSSYAIEINKELGTQYIFAHASHCFDKYLGDNQDKQPIKNR